MITLAFQDLDVIARERNVQPYVLIDELVNHLTMKNFPLTMNVLTKEFEFNHEGVRVFCEADYTIDANPSNDTVEIIGEINEVFGGGVVEISTKVIKREMKDRFSDEIESIREELKSERKSTLRDFGARVF